MMNKYFFFLFNTIHTYSALLYWLNACSSFIIIISQSSFENDKNTKHFILSFELLFSPHFLLDSILCVCLLGYCRCYWV